MNHVVRLETSIREAIIQKQHLVAIFFDLEKAYKTTWRYGIMNDLHNMGFKARLPTFIKAFFFQTGHSKSILIQPYQTLNLDGSEFPFVDQYKFFGIIFDKKLSFIPHIQYLKEKCSKTLKLLCVKTGVQTCTTN